MLGFGLGLCGGMLGIGGGLIAIPALGLIYGMDQHTAQGTALIMVVPNVLISLLHYHRQNNINGHAVLGVCVIAMAFSYLAGLISKSIPTRDLEFLFASFLLVLALFYAFQLWAGRPASAYLLLPRKYLPLVGAVSGAMSGIFTVGGGLIIVPVLVSLFGFSQVQAQGIALALVVPGAVAALFSYAQAGSVEWSTGIALALGGILSVSWGASLAHSQPVERLQLVFCIVLLGAALMMLFLK